MNLWWIRRDLRLRDNPALSAALADGSRVVPVFVLDEHLLEKPAQMRQAFLFAALRSLDEELKEIGSGLVVRRGDPVSEIPKIASEVGATAVFAEEDYTPYAVKRDTGGWTQGESAAGSRPGGAPAGRGHTCGWQTLHGLYPIQPHLESFTHQWAAPTRASQPAAITRADFCCITGNADPRGLSGYRAGSLAQT